MIRIVSIVVLVCLAFACALSDEKPAPLTVQADGPANAWRPEKKPARTPTPTAPAVVLPPTDQTDSGAMPTEATVSPRTGQGLDLRDSWPTGEAMDIEVKGFMDTGFMKDPRPMGFGDLAYTDVFLDFSLNEQGRIDQLDGVINGLYESYSFGIPVVLRSVDAISGSRQVNWEDVIVKHDANHWSIQPVCRWGGASFEVVLENGIEFRDGDTIIRITKSESVFSYVWSQVG
ncbi:MAG: hypothetical protein ABIJ86_03325, partial [Spirochaetota bacterium]